MPTLPCIPSHHTYHVRPKGIKGNLVAINGLSSLIGKGQNKNHIYRSVNMKEFLGLQFRTRYKLAFDTPAYIRSPPYHPYNTNLQHIASSIHLTSGHKLSYLNFGGLTHVFHPQFWVIWHILLYIHYFFYITTFFLSDISLQTSDFSLRRICVEFFTTRYQDSDQFFPISKDGFVLFIIKIFIPMQDLNQV